MIKEGYGDQRAIGRRITHMESWLAAPSLLEADADAQYAAQIDIDLADVTEPILCAPNDPDDARLLSSVAGDKVDEVFIGSCMTNIGHFRAAGRILESFSGTLPTRLWIAPPTKMDESELKSEGFYGTFGSVGARTEMPGALCVWEIRRVSQNVAPSYLQARATFQIVSVKARMFTLHQQSWLLSVPFLAVYHLNPSILLEHLHSTEALKILIDT